MDTGTANTLVPRHRFGRLLRQHREQRGVTCSQLARRGNSIFDARRLEAIERGIVVLDDTEIDALCQLYGVSTGELVPARSSLLIDADERMMKVGDSKARIAPNDPTGVLQRYLALVYRLRGLDIGDSLSFRREDVLTLAVAFDTDDDDVIARLQGLVDAPESLQKHRTRLRQRLMVPAAGVFVSATALGALVMIGGQAPASAQNEPLVKISSSVEVATEIGSAIVLERDAQGQPGIQEVRLG